MIERKRGALILTHNRPELLLQCVDAIRPQVDVFLIIDNASDPPVDEMLYMDGDVICIPTQPPNLSELWNFGFDVYDAGEDTYIYDVAVLDDDAIVPPGWFEAVTAAMRETGAAIGCSDPWGAAHPPILKTAPDDDLATRMQGCAWIIDMDKGLRADERFHWWWGDTDIDWQARSAGGMVMIGGFPVPNMLPNQFLARPDLTARVGLDTLEFIDKWGYRPW